MLNKIEPRPYLLENKIQNYQWGEKGKQAFIPLLVGIEAEKNTPYAELWMGAHESAPSCIMSGEKKYPLDGIIKQHSPKIIGKERITKNGARFPFLFKVLSAGAPLSIQAHPNKKQAKKLRLSYPEHYPDDNHKPEIAIALDTFTALVGFKKKEGFIKALRQYPEITEFIGTDDVNLVLKKNSPDLIKILYGQFLNKSETDNNNLKQKITQLKARLEKKETELTSAEVFFMTLYPVYRDGDPGLFTLFLLNLVTLEKGEAIYLHAGLPHAYLEGNILECMANSDNVVRLGLTPKFKDTAALSEIMDYQGSLPEIIGKGEGETCHIYQTPSEEFQLTRITLNKNQRFDIQKKETPEILLVLKGSCVIRWEQGSFTIERGSTVLNPAILEAYSLTALTETEIYKAEMP